MSATCLYCLIEIMQRVLHYQVLLMLEDTMLLFIYSALVPVLIVSLMDIMYVVCHAVWLEVSSIALKFFSYVGTFYTKLDYFLYLDI